MDNEKEELTASVKVSETAQGLIDAAFNRLKDLGGGEEIIRLFPNGIESIDLEISVGIREKNDFHMALKIDGTEAVKARTFTLRGETEAVVEPEDEEDTNLSFNSNGHHIIFLIALRDLEVTSPTALQRVNQILQDGGGRTPFEAANYADAIRNQQPETKPFHYVDIPLRENGPRNPPLPNAPHVLSKIDEFTDLLSNGGGNHEETVNRLSWLIHLFGDVHQPLHCVERFNQFNVNGDRGGNGFRLRGRPNNLHSLWDGSVNMSRNIDDEDLAIEIFNEHTRDSLATSLQIQDTERWARDGFNLAKSFAYTLVENPQNPPRPPAQYKQRMEQIGRRQAALGGYRLSNRLKQIFE